jgi:hypothetical protein
MNERAFLLLLFLLLSPLGLMAIHALAVRLNARAGRETSLQKLLVKVIALANGPILVAAWLIAGSEGFSPTTLLYVVLCFNAFGYCYFHFFNMSETARRVKIVITIKKGKALCDTEFDSAYTPEEALRIRLERLEQLSQIRKGDDGNYRIRSRLFYRVSFLIMLFRYLLGFQSTMRA